MNSFLVKTSKMSHQAWQCSHTNFPRKLKYNVWHFVWLKDGILENTCEIIKIFHPEYIKCLTTEKQDMEMSLIYVLSKGFVNNIDANMFWWNKIIKGKQTYIGMGISVWGVQLQILIHWDQVTNICIKINLSSLVQIMACHLVGAM